jgi:hypothetical protein
MTPSAFGTESCGTKRMTVAVASDQNPPITMPKIARATIKTRKFGARAIRINEDSISAVNPIST